jgi:hypothetical protein
MPGKYRENIFFYSLFTVFNVPSFDAVSNNKEMHRLLTATTSDRLFQITSFKFIKPILFG